MLRICTVVALLATAAPAQTREQINELIEKANTAIKAHKNAQAYALLERLHELAPNTPKLAQNLANISVALASEFVERGQYARASSALKDAIRWKPDEAVIWYYVGVVEFNQGNLERCREPLEKAIALDDKLFEPRSLLGMVLYETGHHEEAIKHLLVASRLKPGDARLAKYLRRAANDCVLDSFETRVSRHFVIHFDGEDEELGELIPDVVQYLESIHLEFTRTFRGGPKNKIPVVFYSKTQFRRSTLAPHWAGGYFDGKVRVPLDSWLGEKRKVKRTLRHELAHAFVTAIAPHATSWVQEGIAMWAEGQPERDARAVLQRSRQLMRIARMRQPFATETDVRKVNLLYAQSLAMVSQLLSTKNTSRVPHFLRCFANAKGTAAEREDRAMRRVYGKPVAGLLEDYASRYHLVAPPR